MSALLPLGIVLFIVGFLPHLAFTFLSPGLGANGIWDVLLCSWSVVTLIVLLAGSMQFKPLWFMALIQILLMALLLMQTFSDAAFYIGT